MIQIRKGLYETNSSSVHTMVIDKSDLKGLPSELVFTEQEFAWEFSIVKDTCNYFWTALIACIDNLTLEEIYPEKAKEYKKYGDSSETRIELAIKRVTDIFANVGVKTRFILDVDMRLYEGGTYTGKGDDTKYISNTRIIASHGPTIDHGSETIHFIREMLKNTDLLIKFCCGVNSEVITSNDNDDLSDYSDISNELKKVEEDTSGKYAVYYK